MLAYIQTAPLNEHEYGWLQDDAEVEGVLPRLLSLNVGPSLTTNWVRILDEKKK